MKKTLHLIIAIAIGQFIFAQDCSDLFISEYVEGSANNKAIEIYNPTDVAIDLGEYIIKKYGNGSPEPTDQLQLSGIIQPYDVVVVTNGQVDSVWVPNGGYWSLPINDTLYDLGDLHCTGEYPTVMYYNGNDVLTLEKSENDIIDIFGKIGEYPGSNGWNDIPPTYFAGDDWWTSWTSNQTLIRKPSVKNGVKNNPDIFIVNVEWDSLPNNTFENLGFHDCDCFTTNIADEPLNIAVKLFPNPITDRELNIESEEVITVIELLNTLGQTILKEEMNIKAKNHTLKLTGLDYGIFFVRITFINSNTLVKKIVVE